MTKNKISLPLLLLFVLLIVFHIRQQRLMKATKLCNDNITNLIELYKGLREEMQVLQSSDETEMNPFLLEEADGIRCYRKTEKQYNRTSEI